MITSITYIVDFVKIVKLPNIWEENQHKLPKDMKIENLGLMLKGNTLRHHGFKMIFLGVLFPIIPVKYKLP